MRMKTSFSLISVVSQVNLTVDGDRMVAVKFCGASGSANTYAMLLSQILCNSTIVILTF